MTKDRDTLMEQSLCTQFSNRAVTHACKLDILQLIFTDAQQNRKISRKILSHIGKKIKELLERKIGRKKSKIDPNSLQGDLFVAEISCFKLISL